ncbi:MAG: hydrogenase maturation protease, partial [Candidatus Korarchaeum sp.]|nr:hydrogenase maturation protease [Candidatus Korarchaeum sp.]
IIKSSESGLWLLDYFLSGYDLIILVDSILGSEAGELVRVDPSSLRQVVAPSPHYYGVPEILSLLRELDERVPEVEIYCITINESRLGSPVSEEIRVAAKKLADVILSEILQLLQTQRDTSPNDF